jgi:hypothetical protein
MFEKSNESKPFFSDKNFFVPASSELTSHPFSSFLKKKLVALFQKKSLFHPSVKKCENGEIKYQIKLVLFLSNDKVLSQMFSFIQNVLSHLKRPFSNVI